MSTGAGSYIFARCTRRSLSANEKDALISVPIRGLNLPLLSPGCSILGKHPPEPAD